MVVGAWCLQGHYPIPVFCGTERARCLRGEPVTQQTLPKFLRASRCLAESLGRLKDLKNLFIS
ncbi:hypothetical protein E2C01_037437 [Portunus trituberculatus]|uniref:Uncharacterized protein n=1 Tax=Portunus trituberculatus TaxID=210409 RepID=A0A5B7FE51_PORTR|nr:hypothetical protein [Portunus trituberculatus]